MVAAVTVQCMSEYAVRQVGEQDLRKVLRLSLATQAQSAADLEAQVTAFIRYARTMNLDLSRTWWCLNDGTPLTGCACLESPGRTAMLFISEARATTATREATTELIRHVIAETNGRNLSLLQCLLKVNDSENAAVLSDCGFHDLAELLYLEWHADPARPVSGTEPQRANQPGEFEWVTYGQHSHADFADTIAASYIESLDCPGLLGLRDIEDVIEGHKAAGRFDPDLWFLARMRGENTGCILFVANPIREAFELAYLGVRPEYRRCGIGRLLVQRGLGETTARGCSVMTVAVDANNAPALKLYTDLGFRVTTSRRAFILPLRTTSAAE